MFDWKRRPTLTCPTRRRRRSAALLVALALVALGGLLTGCGSNVTRPTITSASFLGRATNALLFVQWTRNGEHVTGSLSYTVLSDPSGSGVTTQQTAVTGAISGKNITLQLARELASTTAAVGQLTTTGFTLTFPGQDSPLITIPFVPSQVSEYDQAVHALELEQYSSPCTLYVADHDATLTITGPRAASDCLTFINSWPSDAGVVWTTEPQQPVGALSKVCNLAFGSSVALVSDDGEQTYGGQACNTLESSGWTQVVQAPVTEPPQPVVKLEPFTACDPNVHATASAGCSFAENVFYEFWKYWDEGTWTASTMTKIGAFSPPAQAEYDLSCKAIINASTISCTVESQPGDVITFPLSAIRGYTTTEAQSFAASSDLRPLADPVIIMGNWAGMEPTMIALSADGGNIVTDIAWSSWTTTGAVGSGTSGIQHCVPDCAQGTVTDVPTQITLSEPHDGIFERLTETRAGQISSYSYLSRAWPTAAS